MSSSINVYAVPLDRLKQVVGSRDQATINAIVERHKDFLSSIDDIDEDAELTCADAVAELINGELSEDAPSYLYGYAVEAICSHLGVKLSNICPIAHASEWIEEVDGVLETKGIPVWLNGLVFAGSPVRIPEPDDCPFIGKWTTTEIAAARAAFKDGDVTHADAAISETLRQLRDWVEAAANKPSDSIVGFLS